MPIDDLEGMPEDERLAIVERLKRDHPGFDVDRTLAGSLAGRATPGRPDLPPWGYLKHLAAHPEVTADDLIGVRFPVVFFGGEDSTIESAEEHLREGPMPPTNPSTLASFVDLWARLHVAGVARWNSELRAVEYVAPEVERDRVIAEWGAHHLEGRLAEP